METAWDTEKKKKKNPSTSRPAYTEIGIYWGLFSQKKVHDLLSLVSVPSLPLSVAQYIKPWYYMMQKCSFESIAANRNKVPPALLYV